MTDSEFINLDLDIESTEDLTPLAMYLNNNACLLSHERVDEIDYITVEASLGSKGITPEISTRKMLSLIESMPENLYRLFAEAKARVFDFGFEGGYETNPYRTELDSKLLALTARHSISFRFTIYSYRKEDVENA